MTDLFVELEWWRDAKGYRLVDAEAAKAGPPELGILRVGGSAKPQRVLRLGGDLLSYRPLVEFGDVLFREFAKARVGPSAILNFIQRFGPLTREGLDLEWGEDVPQLIQHAKAMYAWLDACRADNRAEPSQLIGPEGIALGRMNAGLIVDPISGAPRMTFTVDSLRSALWMQLGQALSRGATFKQCVHCGRLFEAGPGTTRRFDAKFCSDEHRVVFNSRRRTMGSSAHA